MEKKGQQQEEEKKASELIRQLDSTTLEGSEQIIPSSALITQQSDPIIAIEKELRVKLDPDTKDKLREIAAGETNY